MSAAAEISAEVTAIVPVWNRSDLLEGLLQGLRAQTYPISETLIIDDGSQDDSAALAAKLGARVIAMGVHGGFAKAVNRGIRESRTPLVAILNNDVTLAPDWLARLAAALDADSWFATGKILQSARPDRIDATFDAICRGGTACRIGHGADARALDQPRPIHSAPFTAALFRAGLFERVGLLDERFESYLEDVDFGLRCALAGCHGKYVPDVLAWHQGSATLGRRHPEVIRLIARNQVFLVAKHFPESLLWRYGWHIAAAQMLWGMLAARHGTGSAWLRGAWEGFERAGEFRATAPAGELAAILRDGEREIQRAQRESGGKPDTYWKMYFLLTGGAK